MGLDWIPLGKPRPENKAEFEDLFLLLTDRKKPEQKGSWIKRALGMGRPENKEELAKRFVEIPTITPYETLHAPMVGRDDAANAWVKNLYDSKMLRDDLLSKPFEAALHQMMGFYVVDLVPESDGIPIYGSGPSGGGVLGKRKLDWEDESSPEAQAHIVDSAARWCLFWGERGHGLEADF